MPRKFSTSMYFGLPSSGLSRAYEGFALHGIQDRVFGWEQLAVSESLGFLDRCFWCVWHGVGPLGGWTNTEITEEKQQNQQRWVRENATKILRVGCFMFFFQLKIAKLICKTVNHGKKSSSWVTRWAPTSITGVMPSINVLINMSSWGKL